MSLWRKLVLAWCALTLLVLAGRWIFRALASDETKIRWRIEEMVDGFNDCKNGRVLSGLAKDFRDRATGATREQVQLALAQLFFEYVDSRTHEFELEAELVADDLAIEVEDSQPKRATAAVHVVIHDHRRAGEAQIFWDAHVSGRLEKGDDGWQWTETTEVNHRDRATRR